MRKSVLLLLGSLSTPLFAQSGAFINGYPYNITNDSDSYCLPMTVTTGGPFGYKPVQKRVTSADMLNALWKPMYNSGTNRWTLEPVPFYGAKALNSVNASPYEEVVVSDLGPYSGQLWTTTNIGTNLFWLSNLFQTSKALDKTGAGTSATIKLSPLTYISGQPQITSSEKWRITNAANYSNSGQFNAYYTYLNYADGIPILGSNQVDNHAIRTMRLWVLEMLKYRSDIKTSMVNAGQKVVILADNHCLKATPEYQLEPNQPTVTARGRYWLASKSTMVPEENIYRSNTGIFDNQINCVASDTTTVYRDALSGTGGYDVDVGVHEFSHAIFQTIMDDPQFQSLEDQVRSRYCTFVLGQPTGCNAFPAAGSFTPVHWKEHMADNVHEYWAVGTTLWFGVSNEQAGSPAFVSNRAQLQNYDPTLYNLLSQVYAPNTGNCGLHVN